MRLDCQIYTEIAQPKLSVWIRPWVVPNLAVVNCIVH